MRRKYGIFIVVFIILVAGLMVSILNKFYSFDYLYNFIIKRDFAINPRVEIVPEKEYEVRIWYYPFYRTINDTAEKEFFKELKRELELNHTNIKLFIGEVDFATGQERLMEAIKDGNPPDIYFNLSDYTLIDENLQVPVSPYISEIEKEGYYTVNWNKINHRDKLWGWPILVQQQYWLANKGLELHKYDSLKFFSKLNYLEEKSLLLNYYDETLLTQLLTLVGLDTFKLEKGKLDIDTYRALEEVFNLLYSLKKNNTLYSKSSEVPDIFLKELLEGKSVIIGPVNPYLAYFIKNKVQDDIELINLNNIVQTYSLNIFRQKKYKGDDHTRAVMEVARIISQNTAKSLSEDLGLENAYIGAGKSQTLFTQELLVINPEYKKYWQEVVYPVWLEFWEKDLSPAEVMGRL